MQKHSPHLWIMLLVPLLVPALRAQSIGMAPADVRATFKPGTPFEVELNVQNYGSTPVRLSVQITDFWFNDKNEKTFGTPGTSPRSAANWIQFVPETFELARGGTQKMKAIITPPANVEGGYYATLFVVSQPVLTNKVTTQGGAVYTNMRLGCLVLLTAKGTEKYDVKVGQPELTPPTASKDLQVKLAVDNQSNVHIFPRLRLAILDSQHKLVGKAEGDEKRLLPGQKDSLVVNWSGRPAPGTYTAVVTMTYAETHVETRTATFEVKP
jgi:hypothetical protein